MAIHAYCYITYFVYITEKKEEDLFNQNRLTSLLDMHGSTTIHVPPGRSPVLIRGIKGLLSSIIMQMYRVLHCSALSMVESSKNGLSSMGVGFIIILHMSLHNIFED